MGRRSWLVVVDGQESCIPMRRREEAAKIINPTLMDVPSSGSEMPFHVAPRKIPRPRMAA